ncbi:MAG: helix-hairpin-helix domain-containing protein [Flavobacteriales bacterium]|nr:helix-hairpin-helix domain-containing protein [Flavobacteriales bacterium]MCB9448602.1 helix-hairpin-helix domain-containing protein [Flavobacteriales bacterium]
METCENKALIERDGTSQAQRLLKSLLPSYVAVDERSMRDLITFAQNYAAEINYVALDGTNQGDWQDFFNSDPDLDILLDETRTDEENFLDYIAKKGGYVQPHFALFIAFLWLFRKAQDDLNTITKRHLDFYYKDVLRLKEQPAEADQVFLIFELARHVKTSHAVKEGTALKAGKDDSGQPLTYLTDDELVVNHGAVSEIKSVFADINGNHRLYASPVANSADGEGAEIESEDMSWETFGNTDRAQADVGFAIASPNLLLAEGRRTVTVTLQVSPTTPIGKVPPYADQVFDVVFSGEEEWISPEGEDVVQEGQFPAEVVEKILAFVNGSGIDAIATEVEDDPNTGYGDQIDDYDIGVLVAKRIVDTRTANGPYKTLQQLRDVKGMGVDKINDLAYTFRTVSNATIFDPDKNTITIIRTLEESQPAVVAYNEEVLLDPFKTGWPVMKVTVNKEYPGDPYAYKYLKDLDVTNATVTVNVYNVKTNILQNDAAKLDPAKPFQPFGNRPVIDSAFYIGNQEIFQKNLDNLSIHIQWHELPENESFGTYYNYYTVGAGTRQNTAFKTEISILDEKEWVPVKAGTLYQLFDNDTNTEIINPENEIFLSVDNTGATGSLGDVNRDPEMEVLTTLNTTTQKGFLRMRMKGANFGHKDYSTSYTQQVLAAVTADPATTPNLPNEPYTPTIKELALDYTSTVELDLTGMGEDAYDERVDQYFYVYPFGVAEADTREKTNNLLPVFDAEGNLYIGIESFTGGRNLSLLFQVAEGSADPDYLQQDVTWSYLTSGNTWTEFDQRKILTDSTNQLLTSGIIEFNVPKDASVTQEMLGSGKVWLRATVQKDTPAISDLVDIMAQAVTATFTDQDNDPQHLATALPAETIKKLKESDSAIDTVTQPFSSFGGKLQETSEAFYTRVSERLRHKHRAVTIWDYERLTLAKFPSVYKVKCLNHTIFNGTLSDYDEIAPGHVSLIVIPNVINRNAVDPLKPKTSLITLTEIEQYLTGLKAECPELHVRNPLYEEIQVEMNVKFIDGIDNGYYQEVLNDEIKSFLSPWAYADSSEITFGGRIHKSMILNFVEERSYVDYVTCFKMYHIVPNNPAIDPTVDRSEARATTLGSVLGSANDHILHVLESEICGCDDNEVFGVKEMASDPCGCD